MRELKEDIAVAEGEMAPLLPEIVVIHFVGNTHFSGRTLRKQMATPHSSGLRGDAPILSP
jgi:hypothetical protein